MSRRFLHLVELPLLLIELLLDLCHPLQLSRLVPAVWLVVMDAPARGTNRRIELVDPRLQSRHLIFLRQYLSPPLVSRALFGQALLRRTMVNGLTARARFRLCLGRFLVRVRILRNIRVRDHLWLRNRCSLAFLLPVLARNIAKRLSIGG